MNNTLQLSIPIELLDYPWDSTVTPQMIEKVYICWVGVRHKYFIDSDGNIQTKELRNLLGTDYRLPLNLCAQTKIDCFEEYRRWATVECSSAAILKKLSLFKNRTDQA